MMELCLLAAFCCMLLLFSGCANAALHKEKDLIRMNKEGVGGGKGCLAGRYSFTRDMPPAHDAIKEVGWLTLEPGTSIGFHKHENNEEVYVIVSGTGLFTDTDGSEHEVTSGDISIARKGNSHALKM